jgi:NADH:ubiquinone oxidoreductase subunit 3 (subunit A)
MDKILLSPPMAFIVILIATTALSFLFSKIFSFKPKKGNANGQGEPYACGENNYDSAVSPDYSNFFAFAFFFTIAHVATLIITTIHIDVSRVLITAGLYIIAAIIGLYILMRD